VVRVNFGATQSSVLLFDPTVSASGQQVFSNVNTITLTLSDHPQILQVGGTINANPPTVTNASFTLTEPLSSGLLVGPMVASNNPTSWAITAGNSAGNFAIESSGIISVTAAGATLNTAQSFTLSVVASNIFGAGTSGAASITIVAASGTTGTGVNLFTGGVGMNTGWTTP
jgi:hypothetical protein